MEMNQLRMPTIKAKDIVGYQNVAVVTTRQLADYYGTETQTIRQNFNNNKEWFVEGESYFRLEGKELENFRLCVEKIDAQIGGISRNLNLWMEEGTLLHAKMLNTRPAWLIYKMLVANYFGAHTRKRNRESARKARKNADWYKTRRIGVDDGSGVANSVSNL